MQVIIDEVNKGGKTQDLLTAGNEGSPKKVDKQARRQRRATMKIMITSIAKKIRIQIKDILNSEALDKFRDFDPQFIKAVSMELKGMSKDVKQLDEELTKKDNQVKF